MNGRKNEKLYGTKYFCKIESYKDVIVQSLAQDRYMIYDTLLGRRVTSNLYFKRILAAELIGGSRRQRARS